MRSGADAAAALSGAAAAFSRRAIFAITVSTKSGGLAFVFDVCRPFERTIKILANLTKLS
jgi:hypothetical protein